jgi:hypothetical protein
VIALSEGISALYKSIQTKAYRKAYCNLKCVDKLRDEQKRKQQRTSTDLFWFSYNRRLDNNGLTYQVIRLGDSGFEKFSIR